MTSKKKNPNGRQPANTGGTSVHKPGGRLEVRSIDSLRSHPRQAEFFSELPANELAELAENIRQHGIEQPPEILEDGLVLRGHQRIRAARLLGWMEIDVFVREDLKGADDDAILEVFLVDNLHRRQLSRLQEARCAIRLAMIDCDRRHLTFDWQREPVILKAVTNRLQCTGRNARRYLAVSKTPPSLQEAFERNLLTLVAAASVAALQQEAQDKLSKSVAQVLRSAAEKDPKAAKSKIGLIVKQAIEPTRRRTPLASAPCPHRVLVDLKSHLTTTVAEIDSKRGEIVRSLRGQAIDGEAELLSLANALNQMARQVIPDLCQQGRSLLALLGQIEAELEPKETSRSCPDGRLDLAGGQRVPGDGDDGLKR